MTGYAVYNALNNPVMGYLSDRTRTRWGRRIPFILFGSIPYALFFALLFFAPFNGADQPLALLAWFIVGLFLFETLATVVQTAYYALLPEMFFDYTDRTSVSVRMNIFMTIGLIIGAALPIVIDEDEIKTGQRREGMYFGMSGLIITLAYALSSVVFGWIASAYGYNPILTQQPESTALGFRIFISIPPAVGSLLAILSLLLYPLHGDRLREVKRLLKQKSEEML
jgi:Na+/melibiose symporter-like transporter